MFHMAVTALQILLSGQNSDTLKLHILILHRVSSILTLNSCNVPKSVFLYQK